jgi:hypothetical protein
MTRTSTDAPKPAILIEADVVRTCFRRINLLSPAGQKRVLQLLTETYGRKRDASAIDTTDASAAEADAVLEQESAPSGDSVSDF